MTDEVDELFGPLAATPEEPPKRKRGRPKGTTKKQLSAKNARAARVKHRANDAAAEAAAPAPVTDPANEEVALEWARAVVWAAEHLNTSKMTKRRAGSAMRWTYWQLGKENQKQLLVDLMPKALQYIDKAKGNVDPAGLVMAEQLSIDELKALLELAKADMANG